MRHRRVRVLCSALAASLGALVDAGCSGPSEGVVTFAERPSESTTSGGSSTSESSTPAPAGTGTATGAVNAVFVSDVFPQVSTACGLCHLPGTGGAPIFFGADANATYPLFKARNFHLPNSLFVTRGAHIGPALTTEQRAAVDKWVAAEAGGAADGG